jgi:hypothetical protein
MLRPYYYIDYNKRSALEILQKQYNWEYYGGHHHENLFTKFAIAYWLPEKFGIDKRIITLSSQIMSNEITREEALKEIERPAYDPIEKEKDKQLVLKKLDFSVKEFNIIWENPNKYYFDYPSYMPIYKKFRKFSHSIFKYIVPFTPTLFVENEIINK